jgi:hypothetical protein
VKAALPEPAYEGGGSESGSRWRPTPALAAYFGGASPRARLPKGPSAQQRKVQ